MTFIPVSNACSVQMIFTQDLQRIENVYHVLGAAPFDVSAMQDVADTFKSWWVASLNSAVHINVSLVNVTVKALDSDTSPSIEWTVGLPYAGGYTSTPALPNNVTVAVKWLTGYGGRSYRGRTYHIGLQQSMVSNNTLTSAAHTFLLDGYGDLITDVSTAGYDLAVVSYFHNNAPRSSGVATPIISCAIDPTLDSQRRRLPGRGQ